MLVMLFSFVVGTERENDFSLNPLCLQSRYDDGMSEIEDAMHSITGNHIDQDDMLHAFRAPEGLVMEVTALAGDSQTRQAIVAWDLMSDGKRIATAKRRFYVNQGKPCVESYFWMKADQRKRGLVRFILKNTFPRYEAWGIYAAEAHMNAAGRYVYARLGFSMDKPYPVLKAFEQVAGSTEEYLEAKRLIDHPWEFAQWAPGKAFLLSDACPSWAGTLIIDRKQPGYAHALKYLNQPLPGPEPSTPVP